MSIRKTGIVIATHNVGKISEFQAMLTPYKIPLYSLEDFKIETEIRETGATFESNAVLKALGYFDLLKRPVLADDSGLVVDALDGAPGVNSARYGGVGLDDKARRVLLLENLRNVPETKRSARFETVLAFSLDGKRENVKLFHGEVHGFILTEERGNDGFGYDSLFAESFNGKTFAEISKQEKSLKSHRGAAMRKFLEFISSSPSVL